MDLGQEHVVSSHTRDEFLICICYVSNLEFKKNNTKLLLLSLL